MIARVFALGLFVVATFVATVGVANAYWTSWDCRWVASNVTLDNGYVTSGRTCISFQTTNLDAKTWSDNYTSYPYGPSYIEWLWTRSWGMDSCQGEEPVAYAYSAKYDANTTYGTSDQDPGTYQDCGVDHSYWNYGEMWSKIGGVWRWAGGGWWG